MATTLNVIKTITIRGSAEGVSDVERQLQSLTHTIQGVSVASDKQEKATLSVENAYKRLQTRYDQEFRAQQQLAAVQKTLSQAQSQGLVTQQRASELMQNAIKFHNQNREAATGHAIVLQQLAQAATNSASSLGTLGSILIRLGPVGIAVAASIAAIAGAMVLASKAALELADHAGKLRDLSDTTGFTTDQLQALNKIAAQVGVSGEQLGTGLERFAASMDDIKNRTGAAYQALLQIDRQAAINISNAKSQAEAWDLLAKALQGADVQSRNVAARGIFGRGGIGITRVLGATADTGGLQDFIKQMRQLDLLTDEQVKHWDDLGDAINENLRQTKQNLVSTFAGPTLEGLKNVTDVLREFSNIIQTTNWENFLRFWQTWGILIPVIGPPLFAITNAIKIIQSFRGEAPALPTATTSMLPPPRTMEEAEQKFKDLQAEVNAWRDAVIKAANDNQRFSQALGSTTTPAEQLATKLLLVRKAQAEGSITADQSAEAQRRLNKEFRDDQAKKNAAALSEVATETEKLNEKIRELAVQADRGDISLETMRRAVAGLVTEEEVQKLERQVAALGDAATNSERYAAESARLAIQLEKGQISQETFNRKLFEMNPILKDLHNNLGTFFDTFTQGLLEGKSAVDSLAASLKQLGQSITTSAFKDLGNVLTKQIAGSSIGTGLTSLLGGAGSVLGSFGGPIAGLGVGLGISLLGKLFGGNAEEQQKQLQAQEDMKNKLIQATQATQGFVDQLTQLNKVSEGATGAIENANELLNKTINAANAAQQQAVIAFQTGALPFNQALIAFQAAGQSIQDAARQFEIFRTNTIKKLADTLQEGINSATGRGFINDFTELFKTIKDARNVGVDTGLISQFLKTQAQALVDSNQLVGDSFQDLLRTFPELVGQVTEFNEAVVTSKRSVDELRRASESLDDRILAATTDANTLEGALTLFDRKALREREEEIAAGGENIVKLEQAQALERLNIVQDFNNKSLELERERVNQLNTFARDIATYVNALFAGPESPLSPSQRLLQAQSAFNSQLALANLGNVEALSTITKFAEDYRQAAQAFFGSGANFQTILGQISAQLLAIPAVAASPDPVVQALINTVTPAINATTASVDLTTGAVNTTGTDNVNAVNTTGSNTTSAVGNTTSAVNSNTSSVNNAASQANTDASTQNSLLTSTQSLLNTSNASLTQLVNLNTQGNGIIDLLGQIVQWTLSTQNYLAFIATWAPGSSHALGGWITGGVPLRDSVRLASGGLGMPGEFVVRRSIAQSHAANLVALNATGHWPGAANDNTMLVRIESILLHIAELEERNVLATVGQTKAYDREARFAARKQKVA